MGYGNPFPLQCIRNLSLQLRSTTAPKAPLCKGGWPYPGSPAKPSASGFAGERRRKGVNGAFRPKGGNGVHGLFDDAGGFAAQQLHNCSGKSLLSARGADCHTSVPPKGTSVGRALVRNDPVEDFRCPAPGDGSSPLRFTPPAKSEILPPPLTGEALTHPICAPHQSSP